MYFKANQIQSCYIDLIKAKSKEKKNEILHRYKYHRIQFV